MGVFLPLFNFESNMRNFIAFSHNYREQFSPDNTLGGIDAWFGASSLFGYRGAGLSNGFLPWDHYYLHVDPYSEGVI